MSLTEENLVLRHNCSTRVWKWPPKLRHGESMFSELWRGGRRTLAIWHALGDGIKAQVFRPSFPRQRRLSTSSSRLLPSPPRYPSSLALLALASAMDAFYAVTITTTTGTQSTGEELPHDMETSGTQGYTYCVIA